MSVLAAAMVGISGCFPTLYVPKLRMERVHIQFTPADPVFCGPGSSGPIWSTPEVTTPCCDPCGDPCNSCGQPDTGLQPIDPFGWLRSGSMGTQQIDPIGWILGI